MPEAEKLLKQWGLATAEKKAGREASQGVIDSYVHAGRIGAMIELNCETDFVARTDDFKTLAREIAMQVAATNPTRISSQDEEPSEDGDVPLLDQPYIRDPSKTVQELLNEIDRQAAREHRRTTRCPIRAWRQLSAPERAAALPEDPPQAERGGAPGHGARLASIRRRSTASPARSPRSLLAASRSAW